MKNTALIFLVLIALASCKSVESPPISDSNLKIESNLIEVEQTLNREKPLAALTKNQQKQLDERIPPNIREILDKADEINIYYNVNKETKSLRVLGGMENAVPNAGAILSDASLKKHFLETFYYDASSNESGAMCFSPLHKITAKYNNKTVELDICYLCGNFRGNSSVGTFSGALAYVKRSAPIMNEIIEKYGTDLQ